MTIAEKIMALVAFQNDVAFYELLATNVIDPANLTPEELDAFIVLTSDIVRQSASEAVMETIKAEIKRLLELAQMSQKDEFLQ